MHEAAMLVVVETLPTAPYDLDAAWRSRWDRDGGADGAPGPVKGYSSGAGMFVEGSTTDV